jgi:DNA polymerase-1
VTDKNYGLLNNDQLDILVDRLIAAGKPIAMDTETGYDGPDSSEGISLKVFHPRHKLVGISLTNSTAWGRYVPIGHDNYENVDHVRAARAIWKLVQTGLTVWHNAKFDINGIAKWLRQTIPDELGDTLGIFEVRSDTRIEAALIAEYNPFGRGGLGLKDLSKSVLQYDQAKITSLFEENSPTKRAKLRFNPLELTPDAIAYVCDDVTVALELHERFAPVIAEQFSFIFEVERALIAVLARMEYYGFYLDWAMYEREAERVARFKEQMNEEIQRELSELVGEVVSVNLNSSKQVADILYTKLGLEVKERSEKTNEPSTSESALRGLVKDQPVIKKILQWREVGALLSRYLEKYLNELHYDPNGIARANHNQLGAATGRQSVDGVSYQQWPKKYKYELTDGTKYTLNYRDFAVSESGWRIIGFDYANVELRVMAGLASEPDMIATFNRGDDVHKLTASRIFTVPFETVTTEQRNFGKTWNFATAYGSGAGNLADMLGITKGEAEEYMQSFFAGYPRLRAWMDSQVAEAKANGFVKTKFGRKFKVWEYLSAERWIYNKGDRMAVNAPVQGSAADIMKIAMVRADKAIRDAGLQDKIRLVMTIHDALEFYVHESLTTAEVIRLLDPMVSFPIQGLPVIRSDWHEGYRWGSVVELEWDGTNVTWVAKDGSKVGSLAEAIGPAPAPEAPSIVLPETEDADGAPELKDPEPVWEPAPENVLHVVEIVAPEVPEPEQFGLFRNLLLSRPGKDVISLRAGDQFITLSGNYGLTPEDITAVGHILGGAKVSRHPYDTPMALA